jgi:hypothetical protein
MTLTPSFLHPFGSWMTNLYIKFDQATWPGIQGERQVTSHMAERNSQNQAERFLPLFLNFPRYLGKTPRQRNNQRTWYQCLCFKMLFVK